MSGRANLYEVSENPLSIAAMALFFSVVNDDTYAGDQSLKYVKEKSGQSFSYRGFQPRFFEKVDSTRNEEAMSLARCLTSDYAYASAYGILHPRNNCRWILAAPLVRPMKHHPVDFRFHTDQSTSDG